jgi:coenzyme F420-reducing hydrogenase delta subunit
MGYEKNCILNGLIISDCQYSDVNKIPKEKEQLKKMLQDLGIKSVAMILFHSMYIQRLHWSRFQKKGA